KLEIGRDYVQPRKVRGQYDIGNRLSFRIIPDRVIKGEVPIQLRLEAMQRRKRRLRIQINRQNPMAGQSKMLRQMRGGRGLPAPPLEVDDGYRLELVALLSVWDILFDLGSAVTVEEVPKFQHLFGGVGAPPGRALLRYRPFPLKMQPFKVVLRYA